MISVSVGQRVHNGLYGGRDGVVFAIHGEQKSHTVRHITGGVVVMGGNATFDIVWENGTISRGVPESILHGVQWKIYDEIATPEELSNMLQLARTAEVMRRKEKEIEKQEQEQLMTHYKEKYSYLHPITEGQYPDCTIAAKNIRTELKKTFPSLKFSVRTSRYSGGNSITIRWIDGPTSKRVEGVVNKYQYGSFNGMEDIYEYSKDRSWTDVFGGTKYVFCERSYSDDVIQQAINNVWEDFRLSGPIPSANDFKEGNLWKIKTGPYTTANEEVHKILSGKEVTK